MSYRASERRRRTDRTRLRTRGAREPVVRRVARDGEDVQKVEEAICKIIEENDERGGGETCSGEGDRCHMKREVTKHRYDVPVHTRRAASVQEVVGEGASVNPSRSADVPRHSGGWHFRMTAHSIPYE